MHTEFLVSAKQRYDEDMALIMQHPHQPDKVIERMAERGQLLSMVECLLEKNAKLKTIVTEAREEAKIARNEAFWRRFDKACEEAWEKYPLDDDEEDEDVTVVVIETTEQIVREKIESFRTRCEPNTLILCGSSLSLYPATLELANLLHDLTFAIGDIREMLENRSDALSELPQREPFPEIQEAQGGDDKFVLRLLEEENNGLIEANNGLKDKIDGLNTLLGEFRAANLELLEQIDAVTAQKEALGVRYDELLVETAPAHALRAEVMQLRSDLAFQYEINKNETARKENELMKEALRRLLLEIEHNPAYEGLRPMMPETAALV